eukprot:TRINITY_DN50308_c0_g1_i1.p1 TRINITY_DN50308_c0_g1~~TRINITY_DN50308_c0_g1_i1.p1  ORF type:complete len:1528 (+),score=272.94 TRINITY_DN50308_c0_g1_i1:63-4646(+)
MPGELVDGEQPATLRLAHSFGIYPVPLRDAVISLGDDAFLFCVGRQLAVYDHVTQRVNFLPRDANNLITTAATRCLSGRLLAVGERVVGDGGSNSEGRCQISVIHLPKLEDLDTQKIEDSAPKVLRPQNRRLDIIGLVFATADGRFLVSLSSGPDCTITYWRWDVEKAMALRDFQPSHPMTRLLVNPKNGNQVSISGPSYMRIWEYNPNDATLRDCSSMFPGLNQEKQLNIVDHCWVLGTFLCAATSDAQVHLFEDGEHKLELDVRAVIQKDEAAQQKNNAKEQAFLDKVGRKSKAVPPVCLTVIAPWGRGFVVGGDQGYLGVFKVDARLTVEPFGTFRMPGLDSTIYHMSSSSEDTRLTILSYKEKEVEDTVVVIPRTRAGSTVTSGAPPGPNGRGRSSTAGVGSSIAGSSMMADGVPAKKEKLWALSTFPMSQADPAMTGQSEVFSAVYEKGTHHGAVCGMGVGGTRNIVATIGHDMTLRLWGYPSDGAKDGQSNFSSELSISVSSYEKPHALSVHPLGFQAAVLLDDSLKIYHLTSQQVTRTLYELPLKKPGDVAFSNSGNMLAVTTEHDVVLLDPWRATLIHVFSGRGGHLSNVNQVLFSEDDRTLLSCGTVPFGAIYGWDLESDDKRLSFEHVPKSTTFSCIAFDFRRELVVACTRPEGVLQVIRHLKGAHPEIHPESRSHGYTTLRLAAPLGVLFAGTQHGHVRVFKWPLAEGSGAANPYVREVSLHAHSVSSLALSQDSRYLFSGCEGGAVMACVVGSSWSQASSSQLVQRFISYRYRTDADSFGGAGGENVKSKREDDRKMVELQKKLSAAVGQGVTNNTCTLDELVMLPKSYFNERLHEIKEQEEQMHSLRKESEYAREQMQQETNDRLNAIEADRAREKSDVEEKYNNLFSQLRKANERHQNAMSMTNSQFDQRTRELQAEFERKISKEAEKHSRLLHQLESLEEANKNEVMATEQRHNEQLTELRDMEEKALKEWRVKYDRVCNLLKSDGLKFEESLCQQESEYDTLFAEVLEHNRVALQVESEKSTTALKDGVSMRQTISMLHRQLKAKDDSLTRAKGEVEDLQKKLEASQEMFAKLEIKLRERERGLNVKDKSLAKLREQMKHLESFRFVLYRKVRALEEERDPLEEKVKSLTTGVSEMYSEFVRLFKKKSNIAQQLTDKTTIATSMQNSNVKLQAQLSQLKKDARRFIQEAENVLHAETTGGHEKMPLRMKEVLAKHKALAQWAPTEDEDGGEKTEQEREQENELNQEMVVQRDLLFRKNQIAVGQMNQAKRECTQEFRRLTMENASLIAEMNTLRAENKSWQRSCKEMEVKMLALRKPGNAGGGSGGSGGGGGLHRNASAPVLGGSSGSPVSGQGGVAVLGNVSVSSARRGGQRSEFETPYMRRKVVDQQELYRRQRQKQANQLPPVPVGGATSSNTSALRSTAARAQNSHASSVEEVRFTQTMDSLQAGRRQMERQGFDLAKLTSQAQLASGFYDGSEFREDSPGSAHAEGDVVSGPPVVIGDPSATAIGS